MSCQDRTGFLFAHACERPPAYACAACQGAICDYHARQGDDGQLYCVTCLMTTQKARFARSEESKDDPFAYRERTGNSEGYYDTADYAAFDETDDSAGGSADPAMGPS